MIKDLLLRSIFTARSGWAYINWAYINWAAACHRAPCQRKKDLLYIKSYLSMYILYIVYFGSEVSSDFFCLFLR